MMALLIDLGWKSALIAGAALLANRTMRGRSASERVFLLRLAIAMLLALPAAVALVPALDLAVLPATPATASVQSVPASVLAPVALSGQPARSGLDAAMLVAALYLVGAAALLLRLGAGIVTLARWTRRGTPVADPQWQAALHIATTGLRRPVRLLESRDVATPLSWGGASAWILVDPDSLARGAQADAVLAHEMAHIRRLDWPMLIAAQIAVALFWFNPLAWLVARALARESEIAADEAAVLRVARLDYAEALLAFAAAPTGHRAATGMALWPGALKERIARVIETRGQRRRNRVLLAAMLVCGLAATPTLAALQFVRGVPRDQARVVSPTPEPAPVVDAPRAVPAKVRAASDSPTPAPSAKALASVVRPSPDPALVSATVIAPVVVPVSVAVPVPITGIVGRTGATASQDPGGAPITGAPDDRAEAEREEVESRREAAQELRQQAIELSRQADELERSANETGQLPAAREGMLTGARSMRNTARGLEAQAAKLAGS